jgi:hypothetical protein
MDSLKIQSLIPAINASVYAIRARSITLTVYLVERKEVIYLYQGINAHVRKDSMKITSQILVNYALIYAKPA